MKFEEIKKELLEMLKGYEYGIKKVSQTQTKKQLFNYCKGSSIFLITEKRVLAEDFVRFFGTQKLVKNHLYMTGRHDVLVYKDADNIIIAGDTVIKILAYPSSTQYIVALDEAHVKVHIEDSTNAIICMYGKAYVDMRVRNNATAKLELWNNTISNVYTYKDAFVDVTLYDDSHSEIQTNWRSSAKVASHGNSVVVLDTIDTSSAKVETYDYSIVSLDACDESFAHVRIMDDSKINVKILGAAYMLDLTQKRFYTKKDYFDIKRSDDALTIKKTGKAIKTSIQ